MSKGIEKIRLKGGQDRCFIAGAMTCCTSAVFGASLALIGFYIFSNDTSNEELENLQLGAKAVAQHIIKIHGNGFAATIARRGSIYPSIRCFKDSDIKRYKNETLRLQFYSLGMKKICIDLQLLRYSFNPNGNIRYTLQYTAFVFPRNYKAFTVTGNMEYAGKVRLKKPGAAFTEQDI